MLSLCWAKRQRVKFGLCTKAQMNTQFLGYVMAMLGLLWIDVGPMLDRCWDVGPLGDMLSLSWTKNGVCILSHDHPSNGFWVMSGLCWGYFGLFV